MGRAAIRRVFELAPCIMATKPINCPTSSYSRPSVISRVLVSSIVIDAGRLMAVVRLLRFHAGKYIEETLMARVVELGD